MCGSASIPTNRPQSIPGRWPDSRVWQAAVTTEISKDTVTRSPAPTQSTWLTPFVPFRGLKNSHLQTIVGNFLPRPTFTLPAVGLINPTIILTVVLFPEPFGPRNPKTSPFLISRLRLLTAVLLPNFLVSPVVRRITSC